MISKRNQILFGVILLILGITTLWKDVFVINYKQMLPFVLLFVGGFAFLLLYRTKRKNWALFIGSHLVYIAVLTVKIGKFSFFSLMFPSMFFIVPGIVLLVLYFDKNKHRLLIPGSLLLFFGVWLIIARSPLSGFTAQIGSLLIIAVAVIIIKAAKSK